MNDIEVKMANSVRSDTAALEEAFSSGKKSNVGATEEKPNIAVLMTPRNKKDLEGECSNPRIPGICINSCSSLEMATDHQPGGRYRSREWKDRKDVRVDIKDGAATVLYPFKIIILKGHVGVE